MRRVKRFIQELAPGAIVADVGCGNGKYFGVRPDIAVLGSDRSSGLAQASHHCARMCGGRRTDCRCCLLSHHTATSSHTLAMLVMLVQHTACISLLRPQSALYCALALSFSTARHS